MIVRPVHYLFSAGGEYVLLARRSDGIMDGLPGGWVRPVVPGCAPAWRRLLALPDLAREVWAAETPDRPEDVRFDYYRTGAEPLEDRLLFRRGDLHLPYVEPNVAWEVPLAYLQLRVPGAKEVRLREVP